MVQPSYIVVVGKGGRITLPLAVLAHMGVRPGDAVVIEPQPERRLVMGKAGPAPDGAPVG